MRMPFAFAKAKGMFLVTAYKVSSEICVLQWLRIRQFCFSLYLLAQRMQKLATARQGALRTLKTSQAHTRAETIRQRKIQEAREQLGK